MMARLTKNQLQDRKIYNEWGLASLQDSPRIYMQYFPSTDGVTARYARWSIQQNEIGGEINGIAIARPSKQKKDMGVKLLAWASEMFDITSWERSPFGSYHPTGTMDRAKALEATP